MTVTRPQMPAGRFWPPGLIVRGCLARALALLILVWVSSTGSLAQGISIRIEGTVTQSQLTELRTSLPLPDDLSAETVQMTTFEMFTFIRTTDARFCVRMACLTFVQMKNGTPSVYLSMLSTGRAFLSDEMVNFTPHLSGMIINFETGVTGKSINVLASEKSLAVLP